MGSRVKIKKLRIDGMTCVNCRDKIEKKLRNAAGVEKADVSYSSGTALVTYDTDIISFKDIAAIIEKLGYKALSEEERIEPNVRRVAGTLIIIAALYALLRQFGILNVLAPNQLVDERMGYGMLFVIGLITSVHCVAMCGGINLSQCLPRAEETGDKQPLRPGFGRFHVFRPALLYNMGRIISYTTVGFIVGGLGSAFAFSNVSQGVVKLVAGAFMVIMGVNMLGLFPWLKRLNLRMPKVFADKIAREKHKGKTPLAIGLLNGLMPCGPLQAMQIYALSTGNPFAGALSMFLFSFGTAPLMFGFGALSSALGKRFTRKAMTAGATLVTALGMLMFSQGWNLSGAAPPVLFRHNGGGPTDAEIENGEQVVRSELSSGEYPNIVIQAGMPVRWIIDAPEGSVNGCNNRMFIPEYGVEYSFKTGENVIEFNPTRTGTFRYSCWMGMIRGSVTVTDVNAIVPSG
ncbi:MAG: sulfite exporter TauE/SafE family protein [Clostridiales bacterium]|jgi:sulfite exporter TauE/SafE|nr:sulfite exporter TauE/SafE family protein [Clostridiales bacterium]